MVFVRFLLIVWMVLLAACTSPHYSQELTAGKIAFQSGDYAVAFQKLLPVARAGRPEAQYAVGYMYYYGYGVRQEISSGLEWMDRAAAQHYAPAFAALDMIHRRESLKAANEADHYDGGETIDAFGVEDRSTSIDTSKDTFKDTIKPMTKVKSKKKLLTKTIPQRAIAMHQIPTKARTHAVAGYILQVYGGYGLDDARDVQKHLRLGVNSQIWHTMYKGRDWYVVAAGQFNTVASAKIAIADLSAHVKSIHPWVRPLNHLQAVTFHA